MGCSPWGHKESDMTEHTCIPYTPPPIYPGTGLTGAMGQLSQPRRAVGMSLQHRIALGPQQRATSGAENPTERGPNRQPLQSQLAKPDLEDRASSQRGLLPSLQAECC